MPGGRLIVPSQMIYLRVLCGIFLPDRRHVEHHPCIGRGDLTRVAGLTAALRVEDGGRRGDDVGIFRWSFE